VLARDASADGSFYTAVATTGIYCRPSCPARHPRRENVTFFDKPDEAEAAGYRPCKRCKPRQTRLPDRQAQRVAEACRLIDAAADEPPALRELASAVGLSPHHFHRAFKAVTGITPKAYAAALRRRRVRHGLHTSATVTEAVFAAGYNSSGRFYEGSDAALGMTPGEFREGGLGVKLRFAVGECSLGTILVAASGKGVAAILLGDDPSALIRELEAMFPRAALIGADASFEKLVARVVALVEQPEREHDLPLDIRGTAFQQKVWAALRAIPPGDTLSYAELAKRIGAPKSVRAVAGACAANKLAVAIPCHRVVRTGGGLSGYRWGVERKRALLEKERKA
jgi:AraC family transcriptional regulator of adaptative response/methylated-DNA-[protein]-cysteine methyltransferase